MANAKDVLLWRVENGELSALKPLTTMDNVAGLEEVLNDWNNHLDNTTKHITADERTKWDSAYSEVGEHTSNGNIHVTTADKNEWNSAYGKVVSRGEQLVVNGSGLMGDNTNFSSWTFDGAIANNSAGSFTYASGVKKSLFSDEFFPINPKNKYKISIDAKTQSGLSKLYSFLSFYDVDKKEINVKTHVHLAASTTTLAQDLKAGDTVIKLTSAAGWSTSYSYGFYMAIWNYTNSFGYTYPAGTYTRNRLTLPKTSGNKLDSNCIDFTNNTITLSSAYTGSTIPAGTSVSQGGDAATYKYCPMVNTTIPTAWTTYSGYIGGVDTSGGNVAGMFPPAVAYCKVGFLWNNNTAADQTWITNISVTDVSVTEEILENHTGDTDNPHSVTKSQVGLGSVVNTGDSATPVSGGTTKFTTGGAYTELNKKVDKVTGKGLSTNDFTDAYEVKLNNTNVAYGTCSTAAATAAKVITISGTPTNWSLNAGSRITIKFSATNTASNPTFNVNGTGAKSVWYNTAVITTSKLSYAGYANRPMDFVYDGTQYVFTGWSVDSDSTYSNASLGQGYGTCSTAAATVAKVVSLSSYSLVKGGVVAVKFTYAVPASATMNVNSKGAKAIFYRGSAITANVIKAGDLATFIYDGTRYHLLTVDRDENTTYTHPTTSGNKHIPSGGSAGQILRWSADGTAAWGDESSSSGVTSNRLYDSEMSAELLLTNDGTNSVLRFRDGANNESVDLTVDDLTNMKAAASSSSSDDWLLIADHPYTLEYGDYFMMYAADLPSDCKAFLVKVVINGKGHFFTIPYNEDFCTNTVAVGNSKYVWLEGYYTGLDGEYEVYPHAMSFDGISQDGSSDSTDSWWYKALS